MLALSSSDDTSTLARSLKDRRRTTIVYTSETRSIDGIQLSQQVLHLPAANAIVADAGGSVQASGQGNNVAELDNSLAARWIGVDAIRDRLRGLGHLVGEHKFESSRRYSCFPLNDVSLGEAEAAVAKTLSDLPVEVTVSELDRIDISPPGVTTQSTLLDLLNLLGAQPMSTVVAGFFVNAQLISEGGCWGIVTGEIEPSVKASMVHQPRVHLTVAEGSAGIVEGLETFGFV